MKSSLLVFLFVVISSCVFAQKGVIQIQVSGQVSRPTSSLLTVTNYGYGGSLKGIYGFSEASQQATLEVGYNYFPLKHIPEGVTIYYSALPTYLGYRYIINKKFILEPQAGLSVNRIAGRNSTISTSKTYYNFAYAVGAGYTIKGFEFGLRLQISEIPDKDEDLNFLGGRIAYNINL